MDKAQRADLLRQRFKAKSGLAWRAPAQTKPQVDRSLVEKRPPNPRDWSFGARLTDRRPEWMTKDDPKPKQTISTKHRKGVPALTVIAAKAPKKLVRAYSNAEALISRAPTPRV